MGLLPKRARDGSAAEKADAIKRAAGCITITGGTAQPPRVIGYKRTGANVDITMRVEGRSFSAHSKVLASGSSFFHKIVSSNSFDYKRPIELPGKAEAFETLLEFFYLGEVVFPEKLLDSVLETAHHLRADIALKGAADAYGKRLATNNCLELLATANRLRLEGVRQAVQQLICANFEELFATWKASDLATLPEKLIHSLLSDDKLGITREEVAFEACTAWIAAQPTPLSGQALSSLLGLVRYPTMSRSYLMEHVMCHPLLANVSGGAAALVLATYLDAHYGPPTALCTPRHQVQPQRFCQGAQVPSPSSKARRRSLRRSTSKSPKKGAGSGLDQPLSDVQNRPLGGANSSGHSSEGSAKDGMDYADNYGDTAAKGAGEKASGESSYYI